jgi:hypothetical protein
MHHYEPTSEWQRDYPVGKPSLAWTAADYLAWGMDAPKALSGEVTEADLMDDDEIAAWVRDSVATIKVIIERDKARAAELHQEFVTDIRYLVSQGKVNEDLLEFALNEANFKWYDGRDGK